MIPVVNLVVFFSSEVLLLLLLLSRLICFRVYLRLGEREREKKGYTTNWSMKIQRCSKEGDG